MYTTFLALIGLDGPEYIMLLVTWEIQTGVGVLLNSIPSSGLGCTGTASAVEFCYKITNFGIKYTPPDGYLVYTLSMLSQTAVPLQWNIPYQ